MSAYESTLAATAVEVKKHAPKLDGSEQARQ